jgi:hypothetical protein
MKSNKRFFVFALLGLAALCLLAAAASALSNRSVMKIPPVSNHLPELDKQRLAESLHLRQTLGERVWPGFGSAEIPVMLWNHDYSFLIGFNQAPPGWEMTADDQFLGQSYYRQKSNDPQNFAVQVGGRWAASMATKSQTDAFLMQVFRDILPPVIEGIFPYRLLIQPSEVQITGLAHESFHVFQQLQAPDRLSEAEQAHKLGDQYWQAAPGMSKDWKAEIAILRRAVEAKSEAEAGALARQFLEQRKARRTNARLAPELVDYERQLEWEEGLAKYVELSAWREASRQGDYHASLASDPDFKGYHTFPQRLKQELGQMSRQAGQEGEVRFYYTGMAQALLLDRFAPGWKDKALQDGAWVEDLLNSVVP